MCPDTASGTGFPCAWRWLNNVPQTTRRTVSTTVTPTLALQVFMVAVAIGGLLNVHAVHAVRLLFGSFVDGMRQYDDRHRNWSSPWAARIFGYAIRDFMEPRTSAFPCFEVLFGLVVLLALLHHGLSADFARVAILAVLGFPLALISCLTEEEGAMTPDEIVLPGIVIGISTSLLPGVSPNDLITTMISPYASIFTLSQTAIGQISAGLDACAGAGLMYAVFYAISRAYSAFRNGVEVMGLGAIKAAAMIGAFCGLEGVLPCILISSSAGSVRGLIILQRLHSEARVAFTPFLVFSGIVVAIWKIQIIYLLMRPE